MRVAQIEPVGAHGAMHYYNAGLADGLSSADVDTLLFTSSCGPFRPSAARVATPFAGCYGRAPKLLRAARFAKALHRSLAEARRHEADLVHFHFFGATATERLSLRLARRNDLSVVVTAHDVESLADTQSRDRTAAVYSSVDHLIVHNEASKQALRRLTDSTPIDVIPHGHYLHTVQRERPRSVARQALGLESDPPILLFFGQIKKAKGLDLLLAAMPAVVDAVPETKLLVAGRPWRDDAETYRHQIEELSLQEVVDFQPSFVSEERAQDLFAACDLTVLPYRHVYQSGVALMSMSLGRPILASDLPAMQEMVVDGRNGWLFRSEDVRDLGDRLVEIVRDRARLATVGDAAREHVRSANDWSEIGRRTLDVYRRVANQQG